MNKEQEEILGDINRYAESDAFLQSWIPKLIEQALLARKNAYAPYSHFQVGAALLAGTGSVSEGLTLYTGCNVENASFGATNCAERTAVFSAVNGGCRRIRVIAIAGGPEGKPPEDYAWPCGICRQVLYEFGGPQLLVVVAKGAEDYKSFRLSELLPAGFGPEML